MPPGGLLIFPLFSWHHVSWDVEPDPVAMKNRIDDDLEAVSDHRLCKWPEHLYQPRSASSHVSVDGSEALAAWFAKLNEAALGRLGSKLPTAAELGREAPLRKLTEEETIAWYGGARPAGPQASYFATAASLKPRRRSIHEAFQIDAAALLELGMEPEERDPHRPFVISFSHFVPRRELIPEKRFLAHGGLIPKISGSDYLYKQIQRLQPDVHIFGHTHIPIDITLDGVRYVQWALGGPREQKDLTWLPAQGGMMCVFDATSENGESPQHWTTAGDHYARYEREPWRGAE